MAIGPHNVKRAIDRQVDTPAAQPTKTLLASTNTLQRCLTRVINFNAQIRSQIKSNIDKDKSPVEQLNLTDAIYTVLYVKTTIMPRKMKNFFSTKIEEYINKNVLLIGKVNFITAAYHALTQ